MKPIIQFSLFTALFFLSACSVSPTFFQSGTDQTDPDHNIDTRAATNTRELRDFDQDKDTLYDLLVAEVSAQRDQFNITLLNYIQQARMTRDIEIVKRTINAAQFTKDVEAIHEMALLWIDIDPESISAHQLLALQYSLQKDYSQAMVHIETILNLGGESRVQNLAIGSQSLGIEERKELLELYHSLYLKFPNNTQVGYSYALMQSNSKQYDQSLITLDNILKNSPAFETAIVLRTKLLYDLGKLEEAIEYADDKFDEFSRNHTLARLLASMLIEHKELDRAEQVFKSLMEQYPNAPSFKLSHALVALENGKEETAKKTFMDLLDEGAHLNEANFYLGRIADKEKDTEKAISHYQQVERSIHFEPAIERYSFLLVDTDQADEMISRLATLRIEYTALALKLWQLELKLLTAYNQPELAEQTLENALENFPEDEQFLYIRAMNFESKDDLAGMEEDLNKIISINPKNSIAINALGYTLADKTGRLEEAFKLIELALVITPDNPAIMDSMGWVLFRLGKKEESLVFLLKAFEGYQDGEVAAHLGEVLWSLNQKTSAIELWKGILLQHPKHEILLDAVKRIYPALLEPRQKPATDPEGSPNKPLSPAEKSDTNQTGSGSGL